MASFLEQPRTFNPYVQQLPLDTYAAVGLQQQAAYNEGVRQINAMQGAIAGINVIRDADRQYLQDRLSTLNSRINEVASADWSSQALVNQTGTLAGMIYNDPNLQSAMASTQKYLRDEQDILEAKKSGKWAPENEWLLRRQMSAWLNDPRPGASYQTGGYKPYEDVAAAVIKAWKDAKPNATLVQRPNGDFYAYETVDRQVVGKDGRTLVQTETKALNPDEVAGQINALLTPSQREQLAISGLYHFRDNNDSLSLQKLADTHFARTEARYEDLLAAEKLELSLHAGDTNAIDAIQARIAAIEKKKAEMAGAKSSYREMAAANPDALKSTIYYENWLQGISNMIGYADVSTKIVDNPAYKAQLEELKAWASLRKSLKSGTKSSKGTKDESDSGWGQASGVVLPLSEEQRQTVTLDDFTQKLLTMQQQRDQSMLGLMYRHFGDRYVNHLMQDSDQDGIYEEIFALKPGMEKEASLAMASWWDRFRKGDPDLDITIRETLADIDEKKLVTSRLAAVTADIEKKAEASVRSMPEYSRAQQLMREHDRLPSTVIRGVEITPSDVRKYLQLRQDNLQTAGSAGVGARGFSYIPEMTDAAIAGYGLTRSKFAALEATDRGSAGKSDVRNFEQLTNAIGPALTLLKKVKDRKDSFIKNEIVKYQGIFNQVAVTMPSAKTEQMRPIANFVQTLAANARQTGMGGDTDWSSVREMIGEDHAAETVYSYVQDRDGNLRLRLSNVDVDKGKPQEIVVDSRTARINKLYTPDPLATTRNLLDLGEGIRTGSTFEESIPLSNGKTGRFNVRHEVENFGGRYKVKLYVTDSQSPGRQTRQVPINTTLFADWDQLTKFLQTDVTERFILSLLSGDSTMGGTRTGNLFNGNPLIEQMVPDPPTPE